jgi:hypothetical protein
LTLDAARLGVRAKATYIYCVIQADRKPRLGKWPSGLPGLGAGRLLDAGQGLWIVAADAPLPRFGEASIQRGLRDLDWLSRCAVAHEAVVESWLRARAVVPMKLFTIFDSDARALADIGGKRERLEAIIRRIGGKREWGVRVKRVGVAARQPMRRVTTGVGYLAAKKQVRDAEQEMAARGQSRVNRAFAALSAVADESERRQPAAGDNQPSSLLLDAAFLVDLEQTPKFREAARRASREWARTGYRVELTGPWPPYNFIES